METRIHISFAGRVQGVGFRYTARTIAHSYRVTGWVRNEPDGTVAMQVQGAPEDVRAYRDAIAQKMRSCIESADEAEVPPVQDEVAFEILG